MNATGAGFRVIAAGIVVSLSALAFAFACRLTADPSLARHASTPLLGRLLGESRRALGGNLCEQADRYFHRGVGHSGNRASMGPIQRLADTVRPRSPEHLAGGDIDEMMPWLRFATRVDPHNVDAYLDAAFWIAAEHQGRRELALDILAEARRNNPDEYRIPMQRGRILLLGGEVRAAARAFDAALAMWGTAAGVDPARARLDRAALLDYRGFICELEGDQPAALECYRGSVRAKPGSDGTQAIIRAIEEGRRSRADAERYFAGMVKRKIVPDDYCRHDGDHAGEHEHAPGDHARDSVRASRPGAGSSSAAR